MAISDRRCLGKVLLQRRWQGFYDVVVCHHDCQQKQYYKTNLSDSFANGQTQIAADECLQKNDCDDTSIQDRNGQKVHQAQVEANRCHEEDQIRKAALGGEARLTGDTDGAF